MIAYLWENWSILAACFALLFFTVVCLYFGIKLLIDID